MMKRRRMDDLDGVFEIEAFTKEADGDAALVARALGDIARARGISLKFKQVPSWTFRPPL